MFLRLRSVFLIGLVTGMLSPAILAQATPTPKPTAAPATKPTKTGPATLSAEQVVETTIGFYGFPVGRSLLDQIRKTTFERGTANITNTEGKVDRVPYQRFVIRGTNLTKEKIRLDQEFPAARYSLVFADEKIFGVYNNTVFTPREDALKVFENQIVRGLEALLRYKENESKLEFASREKVMGVDFFVIEVTDKQGRQTKFYISARQFRVMMLTYEDDGIQYKRKFYDYNYAQGTLVPFRTILWAGDKIIEETDVGTITFGQKVDEEMFKAG